MLIIPEILVVVKMQLWYLIVILLINIITHSVQPQEVILTHTHMLEHYGQVLAQNKTSQVAQRTEPILIIKEPQQVIHTHTLLVEPLLVQVIEEQTLKDLQQPMQTYLHTMPSAIL